MLFDCDTIAQPPSVSQTSLSEIHSFEICPGCDPHFSLIQLEKVEFAQIHFTGHHKLIINNLKFFWTKVKRQKQFLPISALLWSWELPCKLCFTAAVRPVRGGEITLHRDLKYLLHLPQRTIGYNDRVHWRWRAYFWAPSESEDMGIRQENGPRSSFE